MCGRATQYFDDQPNEEHDNDTEAWPGPEKASDEDGENGSDKIIYCDKSVDIPVREGEDWDKEAAQTAAAGAQLKREELQNVRMKCACAQGESRFNS